MTIFSVVSSVISQRKLYNFLTFFVQSFFCCWSLWTFDFEHNYLERQTTLHVLNWGQRNLNGRSRDLFKELLKFENTHSHRHLLWTLELEHTKLRWRTNLKNRRKPTIQPVSPHTQDSWIHGNHKAHTHTHSPSANEGHRHHVVVVVATAVAAVPDEHQESKCSECRHQGAQVTQTQTEKGSQGQRKRGLSGYETRKLMHSWQWQRRWRVGDTGKGERTRRIPHSLFPCSSP